LRFAESVEEISKVASDENTELGWHTYTSLSVHSRLLVIKYSTNPFIRSVSEKDKKAIEKLIKLAYILGNRPLKGVLFINQIATALRFYLIFRALIHSKNEEEIEERILHLYGEGASIVGYVGSYRDIAVKNLFLAKYHKIKSQYYEAIRYAKRSFDLASLLGDDTGKRLAWTLLHYLKLLSHF
jgi:hypothetical protein